MSWHFAYVAVIELSQSEGSPDDVEYIKKALAEGIRKVDLASVNERTKKKYRVANVEVHFTHAKADEPRR